MIKIGLDAKRAFLNATGLGSYARNLIEAFANFSDLDLNLYSPKINNALSGRFHAHELSPKFKRVWGLGKQLEQEKIQVYHGLSNELPLDIKAFSGKKIVTIHDLIFKHYPQTYPLIDRKIYDYKSRFAAEQADIIVAISRQTGKDLRDFYGVSPSKIVYIPPAIHPRFQQNITEEISDKYPIPAEYALYVGSFAERKNVITLLKAFRSIDFPLVLVGSGKLKAELENYVQKQGMGSRVFFLSGVADAELPHLYKNAKIFLYPSVFEGFGMPIAEALACGTPVICSEGSSFSDAGGAGALYVPALSVEAWQFQISRLLSDANLQKNLIEAGLADSKELSAERIAAKLRELYW